MTAHRLRNLRTTAAVVGAVALISACNVSADPFENLGTLPGGGDAVAYAINDQGVIVGLSTSEDNSAGEATKWDPVTGTITPLGTLVPGGRSEAVDVNDSGVTVGNAAVPTFTYDKQHAFVARPGQPIDDINNDLGIWHSSAATGINNDGIVVGWAVRYLDDDFPTVIASLNFAFDLSTGVVTPLPLSPSDINDDGIVAGTAGGRARSYDLSTGVLTDLGTLGGPTSHAEAINDDGMVVGQSETSGGEFHGFLYDPSEGVMTDLGSLGGGFSIANGVNDNGDVVGEATTGARHQKPFFYWHVNHRMYDLGTIGTERFLPATDINSGNVVVGFTRSGPAIAWRTIVRFE